MAFSSKSMQTKMILSFQIRRKELAMSKTQKSDFYHIWLRFSYHMQKWHSVENECKQKMSWVLKYKKRIFNVKNPKIRFLSYLIAIQLPYAEMTFNWKWMQRKKFLGFLIRRKEFSMSKTRKSDFYHILIRFSYHMQKWHLVEDLSKQKNCWVFKNVEKNFQCQKPENPIFIIF